MTTTNSDGFLLSKATPKYARMYNTEANIQNSSCSKYDLAFFTICPISDFMPTSSIVETFLRNPALLAEFLVCQAACFAFLNQQCPGLRPILIPHGQYICH